MAKTQGQRGKKGATGTKGAVGKTGPSGMKGAAGAQGLKGATGTKGATGSTGARGREGREGRSAVRTPQLGLTGVYNQIERIYKELNIQMKRMGQLQAELNDVRTKIQLLATEPK